MGDVIPIADLTNIGSTDCVSCEQSYFVLPNNKTKLHLSQHDILNQ